MYTLRLGSQGAGMLNRAVLALVRELRPGWTVETADGQPSPESHRFIPLQLAGSTRWMALLIDRDDYESAATALADGACAVVPMESDLDQFDCALRALTDGTAPYIAGGLARQLAQGVLARRSGGPMGAPAAAPRLTRRETEVLGLVAAGLTNQEIAAKLSLSVNTVRTHLQTLAVKLHATTRAKMVASAWGAGIYGPESDGRAPGSVAS